MEKAVEEYLNKVHQSDFDMLCEVDRICRKHGIQYFLHGGTFLGAVRHQDFIPWDDDVDILFLRKDYERFLEVFEAETGSGEDESGAGIVAGADVAGGAAAAGAEAAGAGVSGIAPMNFGADAAGGAASERRFRLLRFERYPQFFDFITKIADMSLTYEGTSFGAEAFYENRYSHPTLDLFVFDIEAKGHKWQLIRLKLLYALAMGHRPYIDYGKFKGPMKAVAFVLAGIGRCVPFRVIAKQYVKVQTEGGVAEMVCGDGDRKVADHGDGADEAEGHGDGIGKAEGGRNSDMASAGASGSGAQHPLLFISNEQPDPRYWGLDFDPEHLIYGADVGIIRGKEFPIPKLHDKWLTKTYGDYMALPPEDKRKPMHVGGFKDSKNGA